MTTDAGTSALVLFGHGARDARWAEPFQRLQAQVAAQRADLAVRLAYLEIMTPDLETVADQLVADGCTRMTIVPIFFGVGSHLRRDLPLQVEALKARLPSVTVHVADAAGEDAMVLSALADYCVRMSAG